MPLAADAADEANAAARAADAARERAVAAESERRRLTAEAERAQLLAESRLGRSPSTASEDTDRLANAPAVRVEAVQAEQRDVLSIARTMEILGIDTYGFIDAAGGTSTSSLEVLRTIGVRLGDYTAVKDAMVQTDQTRFQSSVALVRWQCGGRCCYGRRSRSHRSSCCFLLRLQLNKVVVRTFRVSLFDC